MVMIASEAVSAMTRETGARPLKRSFVFIAAGSGAVGKLSFLIGASQSFNSRSSCLAARSEFSGVELLCAFALLREKLCARAGSSRQDSMAQKYPADSNYVSRRKSFHSSAAWPAGGDIKGAARQNRSGRRVGSASASARRRHDA